MKIAVVYNRESKQVINLFGVPNREKYGLKSIKRIVDGLKQGKHQVMALEGDKDLVDKLEEFMPQALKGERPGMVFNVSYGIQGQARYTHVPSILEMVGIPYVGSGPLAHSLALDKVVTKMILRQHDLPTPDFAVLDAPGFPAPQLSYPLIVKPKNEAVSMGLRIVHNEEELREAAGFIFSKFDQPVLAEQYIDGREINVGLLGNNPPEAFPPAEILFGASGPKIYTYEDKTHRSGREVRVACPASIDEGLANEAKVLALRTFQALGCYDCARVDMRLDGDGKLYILEVNSLPSLGPSGSYVAAAAQVGLDFSKLINRLVEVAAARYFGTPTPPPVTARAADAETQVFSYLTERRDRIERRVQKWTEISSRTDDPVGIRLAAGEVSSFMHDLGMKSVNDLTQEPVAWTWETRAGMEGGTLLICNLDVHQQTMNFQQGFRRDPERLYGEGIGTSRAPLAVLEFALRALQPYGRRLHRLPLGVLVYADFGHDCRYSSEIIHRAGTRAKRVLVLRPSNPSGKMVTSRRGMRRYQLSVEGRPHRVGQTTKTPEALQATMSALQKISGLSSRKERIALSAIDLRTEAMPMMLPHRGRATIVMSYPDKQRADTVEMQVREICRGGGLCWNLELISDRPPMRDRKLNGRLLDSFAQTAARWEIPLGRETSVWPSVAGLISGPAAVICGLGPAAYDIYTPQESVSRISLVQRTLLLAQFLAKDLK